MRETIVCKNCKTKQDIGNRYCKSCGKALFAPLDTPVLKNQGFLDIFNSVNNLLAVKDSRNRIEYLPQKVENVIQDKQKKQYEESHKDFSFQRSAIGLSTSGFDINPMFWQYGSNNLVGYSFRIAEEIKGRKAIFDRKKFAHHINEFMKQEDKDKYEIYSDDPIGRGLEYGLNSLIWKSAYKDYQLLPKNEFDRHIASIWVQSIKFTLPIISETINKVYESETAGENFIAKNKERLEQEVYDDIFFGYCLRIASSILL